MSTHPSDKISKIPIDLVGVEERCARFQARSIKKESKIQALHMVLNMIDLTTLEGTDNPHKVERLCYKAQHLHDSIPNLPTVAAVCVFPTMVETAVKCLKGSGVKVAAVATGFPAGQVPTEAKLLDCRAALESGADEIDMVISRGHLLSGNSAYVYDEIAAMKDLCGDKTLKVILETGEIGDLETVRYASDLAIDAGADFIKTSTGKIQPAATLPVTYVMVQAIRDHYLKTGKMVGMKPAGGISNTKTAIHYLTLIKECLGTAWLNNDYFRFGASSLANDILMQLDKQKSGRYSAPHYFALD